jgi:cell division protease FtsH
MDKKIGMSASTQKRIAGMMHAFGLILLFTWWFQTVLGPEINKPHPAAPSAEISQQDNRQTDLQRVEASQDASLKAAAQAKSDDSAPWYTEKGFLAIHSAINGFVLRNWMLVVGLLLEIAASVWMFVLWRIKRKAQKAKEAEEGKLPDTVIVNGEKKKLPNLRCKRATVILPGDPRFAGLTFDKLIGQVEAKEDIQEILDMLQNPEYYVYHKARTPAGVLLVGPPGVGKTHLVRIVAALCGLPVIELCGADFVDKLIGSGASAVEDFFHDIRELKKIFGGCIGFMDECESAFRIRGGHNSHEERENTLTKLLKEMDGIIKNEGVVLFGATNRKDQMDPAALRPGRFSRHIEFFNPNKEERAQLLALYIEEELREERLCFKTAAKASLSASGSHMSEIGNEAKLIAARKKLRKICQNTLDEAVLRVMFGARRESQRTVMTEFEIKIVKYHEGGHGFTFWKRTNKAPLRVTLVPRGQSGGHVQYSEEFELLRTREHLLTRLVVALGGWAGTYVMLDGHEDTGVSADFESATEIALAMVCQFGMSKLGKFNLAVLQKAGLVSESLKDRIVDEMFSLIDWAMTEAYNLIAGNLAEYQMLLDALDENETILEHEFPDVFKQKAKKKEGKVIPFKLPPPPKLSRMEVEVPAAESSSGWSLQPRKRIAQALAAFVGREDKNQEAEAA